MARLAVAIAARRKEECRVIQTHAREGFEIMFGLSLSWPVAQMVPQHRERLDGCGYPGGLKGGQILPEARILAVADVVEAMSADRLYRPGLGIPAALREIAQGRGRLYDEQVVAACLSLFEEHGFSFAASD